MNWLALNHINKKKIDTRKKKNKRKIFIYIYIYLYTQNIQKIIKKKNIN